MTPSMYVSGFWSVVIEGEQGRKKLRTKKRRRGSEVCMEVVVEWISKQEVISIKNRVLCFSVHGFVLVLRLRT